MKHTKEELLEAYKKTPHQVLVETIDQRDELLEALKEILEMETEFSMKLCAEQAIKKAEG